MPGTRLSIATTIVTIMAADPDPAGLYRLFAWLSPSFPTGGYSYSHGLEAAAADGSVRDRATLEAWIAAILRYGSGRIDADLFRDAYRAAEGGDDVVLGEVNRRGAAYRATTELALESAAQGAAFLATVKAAWQEFLLATPPHPDPLPAGGAREIGTPSPRHRGEREGPAATPWEGEGPTCHAVAVGAAAAGAGVALEDALVLYLQAFAGNLMSAGLRLGLIGQTDGQRILAALEKLIGTCATASIARNPEDFGSAAFAADLASIAHETQYSRLFRS
jgi:urease accessory protein